MASKRSGDLLGKDLSSFFKSAVSALEDVSGQVLRSGQAGKASLDVQLLKRQRDKALARLGEVLLDEHDRGVALPAAADDLIADVKKLDVQLQEAKVEADKLWNAGDSTSKEAAGTTSRARASDDDDDDDDEP
jgi:phosphatidylserine/phosphatidylglycerophosphate/cardiolipin synthase-like enzyme